MAASAHEVALALSAAYNACSHVPGADLFEPALDALNGIQPGDMASEPTFSLDHSDQSLHVSGNIGHGFVLVYQGLTYDVVVTHRED